jgi:hypothetical protein
MTWAKRGRERQRAKGGLVKPPTPWWGCGCVYLFSLSQSTFSAAG